MCRGSSRPDSIATGGIQGSSAGVRRVIVRPFPYGLYYRVDQDQIAVIALYHCKRAPRGWKETPADACS